MIVLIKRYGDEEKAELFESLIDTDVCLSNTYIMASPLGAVCCGEVIAVDDDGVTLWHIGEAKVIPWGDFDTVEVFTK